MKIDNTTIAMLGGVIVAYMLYNQREPAKAEDYKYASGKINKSGAQKTYPIASMSLCCIWGCPKCKFKWGGKAQGWIKK